MGSPLSPSPSILIVGATSAIAEQCARRWASDGAVSMTLVARDAGKLQRVQSDLRARYPSISLSIQQCADFVDEASIGHQLDVAFARQVPDIVLIAHGDLPDQLACQADLALLRQAIEVNGVSPALWLEGVVRRLDQAGRRGAVGVIGSVAGDRGRQSNYAYGAAKGMLDRYVQGLAHRLALERSGVQVSIIKPGPTATPMTAHLLAAGQKMASAEDVADCIVNGMRAGQPVIYAPSMWRVIMMVIRHLPRFVFHRMKI